jgi:hypothetical protein
VGGQKCRAFAVSSAIRIVAVGVYGSTRSSGGLAASYRTQVSSTTFSALDRYLWNLTYKRATRIVRHQIVDGAASPDDPPRRDYWGRRRRKAPLQIDKSGRWLLRAQTGRGAICGDTFFAVDDRPQSPLQWEQWLAAIRKTVIKIALRDAGTSDAADTWAFPTSFAPTGSSPATHVEVGTGHRPRT